MEFENNLNQTEPTVPQSQEIQKDHQKSQNDQEFKKDQDKVQEGQVAEKASEETSVVFASFIRISAITS